jgi:hypothetical protein
MLASATKEPIENPRTSVLCIFRASGKPDVSFANCTIENGLVPTVEFQHLDYQILLPCGLQIDPLEHPAPKRS